MPSPEARAVLPAARLAVSGDGTALMLIGGGSTQALAALRLARIASARGISPGAYLFKLLNE